MRKVIYGLSVTLLLLGLIVGARAKPAAAPKPVEWPSTITLSSYGPGSTGYFFASAVGVIIDKYTPAKVVQTMHVGPRGGLAMMAAGKTDAFIMTAGDVAPAYYGTGSYADVGRVEVNAAIMTVYVQWALVVRKGVATKIEDLRGKRVMSSEKSAWDFFTNVDRKVFEYYNIADTIKFSSYFKLSDVIDPMITGAVDAVQLSIDSAAILQVAKGTPVDVLDIPKAVVDYMNEKGVSGTAWVTYRKDRLQMMGLPTDRDIHGYAPPFVFSVRRDMPEDLVYSILKAFYEHFDEVKGIHPTVVAPHTLADAPKDVGFPFHPGAIKYYKEKGVWGPEQDARQAKQLARPRNPKPFKVE